MTAAQKHNRMMDRVFDTYHKIEATKKDILPSCTKYSFFLDKAVSKYKISRDDARSRFGQFTHGQWKKLLQLF